MLNQPIVVHTNWLSRIPMARMSHCALLLLDVSYQNFRNIMIVRNQIITNTWLFFKFLLAEPKKPAFIKPLNDLKVTIGQPINLEAQITGFPSPEIKWLKDGAPLRPSQVLNFVNQPGGLIGLKYVWLLAAYFYRTKITEILFAASIQLVLRMLASIRSLLPINWVTFKVRPKWKFNHAKRSQRL